jgi:hypothetical protein
MNDPMDRRIGQILKNWAAEQQPPANGRARLLLLASSPEAQKDQTRAVLRSTQTPASLASACPPSARAIEPLNQTKLWASYFAIAMKPWHQVSL